MIAETTIRRWRDGVWTEADDALAVEEPLEIRVNGVSVSVALRTPGHDDELAVGYLVSEGVLTDPASIVGVTPRDAAIDVALRPGHGVDWKRLERRGALSSACGLCGKTSLAGVRTEPAFAHDKGGPRLSAGFLASLPERLREAQAGFASTGGLHAAALFTADGVLVTLREDIGRHNAVDKVIGRALLDGNLPLSSTILLVSGRAGFELVQKATMAGVPVMAAIGAPSSLAVALARETDTTLIAFLRADRMNVYAGAWRLEENHEREL